MNVYMDTSTFLKQTNQLPTGSRIRADYIMLDPFTEFLEHAKLKKKKVLKSYQILTGES